VQKRREKNGANKADRNPEWSSYEPSPRRPLRADRAVARTFLNTEKSPASRYEVLFQYFLEGFLNVASPGFERAHYQGLGSRSGYTVSGVEGFARTAPLFAAWLASGRAAVVAVPGAHRQVDLAGVLTSALSRGANPDSGGFWGEVRLNPQLTVEAADIALTLWLGREVLLGRLSNLEVRNLSAWLRRAAHAPTPSNNWMLFGTLIEAVLCGIEKRKFSPLPGYDRFKSHYLERGWFYDRPGTVDYYNAWGITYALSWIHLVQPDFDTSFLRRVVLDSGSFVSHLISARGFPIMGRSVCYRTAVPAPLVLRAFFDSDPAWQGLARRGLDCIWRYFVENGALRGGTLTQGYFAEDARILDMYSGPGSSHWGLRSLVPAFLFPADSPFWTVAERPLPVETSDYRIDAPKIGWIVEGRKRTGEVRITIPANRGRRPELEAYTPQMRRSERLQQAPNRPDNLSAKYGAHVYSSLHPFPLGPVR